MSAPLVRISLATESSSGICLLLSPIAVAFALCFVVAETLSYSPSSHFANRSHPGRKAQKMEPLTRRPGGLGNGAGRRTDVRLLLG